MEKVDIFDTLLSVLQEEVKIYRSLVDLLQEEQEGLILADMEAIEDTAKRKETIYLKIKLLEESRNTLVGKIRSVSGIGEVDPTLSNIIQAAGGRCSVALTACQSELRELLTTVTNLVKMNERLVGTSLEFLQGSLTILRHSSCRPVYNPDGRVEAVEEPREQINQRV